MGRARKLSLCSSKNYVVCSSKCRASKITTNTTWTGKTPGTDSQAPASDFRPPVSTTEAKAGSKLKRRASGGGTGEIQANHPSLSMLAAQYVIFYANPNDRPKKVYAICSADITDNWISLRVVNRLNLKSHRHGSVKEAVFERQSLTSTGKYVELACSEKQSRESVHCRFYIAKHPDFDILFGSEFATSTPTQLAQDEPVNRSLSSSSGDTSTNTT